MSESKNIAADADAEGNVRYAQVVTERIDGAVTVSHYPLTVEQQSALLLDFKALAALGDFPQATTKILTGDDMYDFLAGQETFNEAPVQTRAEAVALSQKLREEHAKAAADPLVEFLASATA